MWRDIAPTLFFVGFFLSFLATPAMVYLQLRMEHSGGIDYSKTVEGVLSDLKKVTEREARLKKVLFVFLGIAILAWALMAVGLVIYLAQGG